MPRSRMKPRTFPSSHLAQTTAMSATGELVILKVKVQGLLGELMLTSYATLFSLWISPCLTFTIQKHWLVNEPYDCANNLLNNSPITKE